MVLDWVDVCFLGALAEEKGWRFGSMTIRLAVLAAGGFVPEGSRGPLSIPNETFSLHASSMIKSKRDFWTLFDEV